MAPQLNTDQRTYLMLQYHKRKGKRDFWAGLFADYHTHFPESRIPSQEAVRDLLKKQQKYGTVNNCNSASSPSETHSGRKTTALTPEVLEAVKTVLDRDKGKMLGDATVSPVSTARKNKLGLAHTTWNNATQQMNYHPYKVVRQQDLLASDLPRRLEFCHWLVNRTEEELLCVVVSDEAYFSLGGRVNTQNTRRYAEKKTSNREEGGRPEHLTENHPTFSQKLMVYAGMKRDGTFGLTFYRNESMNGTKYKRLLQYKVLPELREWNGGNLDGIWWQQDGATCHNTKTNMAYLDRQFQDRVLSRKPIQGLDWPARSPDLNPCDFCLWGYLKSKVYRPLPANLDELEANIRREVADLDPTMMRRAILDMKKRANLCIAKNGAQFEK